MLKTIILLTTSLCSFHCLSQNEIEKEKKAQREKIIQEHVYDCADKINYLFMMKEYQDCLDEGIKKDATIAYLWQQKAMPYFKIKKYEAGMEFLEKAVHFDRKRYLAYKGFINCIFVKNYKQAITDFNNCIKEFGNSYEMDHSYNFYIGLSYLQLNDFSKAESYLKESINYHKSMFNEAHYLDLFYYAISLYEQERFDEAIVSLDEAISLYPEFSDAIYYKALCFFKQSKAPEIYNPLINQASEFAKQGFSINEANSVYEPYPYQVKWK